MTFYDEENGFCVLRLKARGQRDLVTVIGHAAMIAAGEWVQAAGTWTNDRTHGLQFRANFLKATAPTTLDGIEKYLGSGMIRGIGLAYAKRLVRAFGEAVFDVIEADPSRLREVEGLGPVRAKRIAAGWAKQNLLRHSEVDCIWHDPFVARRPAFDGELAVRREGLGAVRPSTSP